MNSTPSFYSLTTGWWVHRSVCTQAPLQSKVVQLAAQQWPSLLLSCIVFLVLCPEFVYLSSISFSGEGCGSILLCKVPSTSARQLWELCLLPPAPPPNRKQHLILSEHFITIHWLLWVINQPEEIRLPFKMSPFTFFHASRKS